MHKLQTTLLLGLVATGGVLATSYTPPATAVSSRVDLELSDVVSIRVLDKTATTEIDSIDLELITTPTGAFTSDNFIVEASTSNPTGYKLYMSTDFQKGSPAAYTTDLVNQEDDTYTIPTLGTSGVSLADFSQARGSYVNRWGYSLDNLTYDPVPAHETTEEIGSSSTASAADRTNVYVALNANMDKISGLYKNTLVFSGVANPIQTNYSLHFLPGTPDTVTGLPEDQSASEISASHTFTIPNNVPTRAGYNFTGYTDGTTTYQPEDSITVLGGEDYTGSATLTAMWEDPWATLTTMQQMTSALCDVAPVDKAKTLTDTRDNNTYTVRKLKDGKCWMTQNLRLTGSRTLTADDSDVSSNWTLPAVNETFPTSCADSAYNIKSSTDATTYASYGNYYNWYAATAGTGTCAMASGNATDSICPRGWRLPTGDYSTGEFKTLVINYNYSPELMQGDPAFVMSGHRYSGSTDAQGTNGSFWSSTASDYSSDYAEFLQLNDYIVDSTSMDKYYGFSVRCVAQ